MLPLPNATCCTAERAFRCSVCRVLFSVPPPKGREGLPLKLLRAFGTVVVSGGAVRHACRLAWRDLEGQRGLGAAAAQVNPVRFVRAFWMGRSP